MALPLRVLMMTMVFQRRERRGEGEEKVQGLTPLCLAWIVKGIFIDPDLRLKPGIVITQSYKYRSLKPPATGPPSWITYENTEGHG